MKKKIAVFFKLVLNPAKKGKPDLHTPAIEEWFTGYNYTGHNSLMTVTKCD